MRLTSRCGSLGNRHCLDPDVVGGRVPLDGALSHGGKEERHGPYSNSITTTFRHTIHSRRDDGRVRRRSKRDVAAARGLGASLKSGEVLAAREALLAGEVGEERVHIAREARDRARREEGVHVVVPVRAVVQIPVRTSA